MQKQFIGYMSRQMQSVIDNDKEIIRLRMESEDLINDADILSDEQFKAEAARIAKELGNRIEILCSGEK